MPSFNNLEDMFNHLEKEGGQYIKGERKMYCPYCKKEQIIEVDGKKGKCKKCGHEFNINYKINK